jgi:hypothetical protein
MLSKIKEYDNNAINYTCLGQTSDDKPKVICKTSNKLVSLKNINNDKHIQFIKNLPKERLEVYGNAQVKWDTGITSTMREGNYNVIEFLMNAWMKLSEFYPSTNFGNITSEEYIEDYTKKRFDYHWAKHTPNGEFNGGTMVYVIIGGDVVSDLENLVDDLVSTLSLYNDNIDFNNWSKKWKL